MLLKSKQDAEEFVFWCVTLQEEVLPKGTGALQKEEGYCCIGVAHACTVPEKKQILYRKSGLIAGICDNLSTKDWVRGLNRDVRDKTGSDLWEYNDGTPTTPEMSHKEIGTLLLGLYEEELNYWLS
jgi:hypothetical protein